MKICHFCGREIQLMAALQRTDSCPYCRSDLKCCSNCRFFDPGLNNQCGEPQAEWTPEKEKANFCEFFEFRVISTAGRPGMGGTRSEQDSARTTFDSLFKK